MRLETRETHYLGHLAVKRVIYLLTSRIHVGRVVLSLSLFGNTSLAFPVSSVIAGSSPEITIPPRPVSVVPAFLDSALRRARSALPLNTPADLRNGWFPEQTTVDM